MSQECDHCGTAILQGVEPYEGDSGVYCSGMCRYDEEVLGIDAGDLPR